MNTSIASHSKRRHSKHGKHYHNEDDSDANDASPTNASSESLAVAQARRDFDEALRRAVPSRGRKRSLDEETELDNQALQFVSRMQAAASQDSYCISHQKVAIHKISMLQEVLERLSRFGFMSH